MLMTAEVLARAIMRAEVGGEDDAPWDLMPQRSRDAHCARAAKTLTVLEAAGRRLALDWQPIETAPKDGTEILGYGHHDWCQLDRPPTPEEVQGVVEFGRLGVVVMCWETNDSWDEGDPEHERGRWKTVTKNPYDDDVVPTRWMPLPEPPK